MFITGFYLTIFRSGVLGRERALTDTLNTNWTMEQDQCFLLDGQPIIYKNVSLNFGPLIACFQMTDNQIKLLGHCKQPADVFKGEPFEFRCLNGSQIPRCAKVRQIENEGFYTFSNISQLYVNATN
jgi:hypothetical protein